MKAFLNSLEWVLMRAAAVFFVGFVVCIFYSCYRVTYLGSRFYGQRKLLHMHLFGRYF